MAIESIICGDGFKLKLMWPAGVKGSVIYAVAEQGAMMDDDALMEALRQGTLKRFNAISYGSGTSLVSFMPPQPELRACWVDICCCDYDERGRVVSHERVETCFNGLCQVQWDIQTIPISQTRQAVQITLHNRSKFPIEPGGIGYSVSGQVYAIPVRFKPMERKALPQFDVAVEDTVKMCQIEGSYPVVFHELAEK